LAALEVRQDRGGLLIATPPPPLNMKKITMRQSKANKTKRSNHVNPGSIPK